MCLLPEPLSSSSSKKIDRAKIFYRLGTAFLVTRYILPDLLCNVKYSMFICRTAANSDSRRLIAATGGIGDLVTKRIAALIFIFLGTSLAWMILGSTIFTRTFSTDEKLNSKVGSTWGTQQEQVPPSAVYSTVEEKTVKKEVNDKTITETVKEEYKHHLTPDSSNIDVALNLDHRQKGLLWYSTYAVKFGGDYVFQNPTDQEQLITFKLKFPAEKAIYDDVNIGIDGHALPSTMADGVLSVQTKVAAHQNATMQVSYKSQGMDSWQYRLGSDVSQARNLTLNMHTNFKDIDFAENTLSPTEKRQTANGWDLKWHYTNLLSGFQIGMTMPEKLQPGPLAGEISYFAPVSLLFFFFLMFIITTMRGIDLHPMNYFFLATSFFAFHLLLAYLVDHISIHLAFAICSRGLHLPRRQLPAAGRRTEVRLRRSRNRAVRLPRTLLVRVLL